jgi:predicted RNase H-like HicB family nuclease
MLRKKVAARQMSVVFEPDGAGWHVFIPAVQGCRSHGRSIAEARKNIREALALCDDELEDAARVAKTVEFVEEMRVPKAARRAVDRALKARQEAARKDAEAARTAAEGAKALRRAGLSLRDAGELLQLSHQRVKQLTDG